MGAYISQLPSIPPPRVALATNKLAVSKHFCQVFVSRLLHICFFCLKYLPPSSTEVARLPLFPLRLSVVFLSKRPSVTLTFRMISLCTHSNLCPYFIAVRQITGFFFLIHVLVPLSPLKCKLHDGMEPVCVAHYCI